MRCTVLGVVRDGGRSFKPCQSPKHRPYVFSLSKWRGVSICGAPRSSWRITRSLTTRSGGNMFAICDFATATLSNTCFVCPSATKPIAATSRHPTALTDTHTPVSFASGLQVPGSKAAAIARNTAPGARRRDVSSNRRKTNLLDAGGGVFHLHLTGASQEPAVLSFRELRLGGPNCLKEYNRYRPSSLQKTGAPYWPRLKSPGEAEQQPERGPILP